MLGVCVGGGGFRAWSRDQTHVLVRSRRCAFADVRCCVRGGKRDLAVVDVLGAGHGGGVSGAGDGCPGGVGHVAGWAVEVGRTRLPIVVLPCVCLCMCMCMCVSVCMCVCVCVYCMRACVRAWRTRLHLGHEVVGRHDARVRDRDSLLPVHLSPCVSARLRRRYESLWEGVRRGGLLRLPHFARRGG